MCKGLQEAWIIRAPHIPGPCPTTHPLAFILPKGFVNLTFWERDFLFHPEEELLPTSLDVTETRTSYSSHPAFKQEDETPKLV